MSQRYFHANGSRIFASRARIRSLRIAQRSSRIGMTRLLLQIAHMPAGFQADRDQRSTQIMRGQLAQTSRGRCLLHDKCHHFI